MDSDRPEWGGGTTVKYGIAPLGLDVEPGDNSRFHKFRDEYKDDTVMLLRYDGMEMDDWKRPGSVAGTAQIPLDTEPMGLCLFRSRCPVFS
jgi:hypothetical protein